MLSIVVPLWRDTDLLERLLASIKAKTEEPYEVIVSESETPEVYQLYKNKLAETFPNMQIVSSPPQGHNIAVEKGLEVAKGDYVMWVDVDVIVSKDWWSKMKRIFESDPNIGIVSPMGYPRWDQYVLTIHGLKERMLKPELIDSPEMLRIVESREPEFFDLPINIPFCQKYYRYGPEALARWDYAFEGFIVMTRRCYEENGAYSRNPSGGQEVNISRNARKKGFRIIAANNIHYWHCDSFPECIGMGRAYRRRGQRMEVI